MAVERRHVQVTTLNVPRVIQYKFSYRTRIFIYSYLSHTRPNHNLILFRFLLTAITESLPRSKRKNTVSRSSRSVWRFVQPCPTSTRKREVQHNTRRSSDRCSAGDFSPRTFAVAFLWNCPETGFVGHKTWQLLCSIFHARLSYRKFGKHEKKTYIEPWRVYFTA